MPNANISPGSSGCDLHTIAVVAPQLGVCPGVALTFASSQTKVPCEPREGSKTHRTINCTHHPWQPSFRRDLQQLSRLSLCGQGYASAQTCSFSKLVSLNRRAVVLGPGGAVPFIDISNNKTLYHRASLRIPNNKLKYNTSIVLRNSAPVWYNIGPHRQHAPLLLHTLCPIRVQSRNDVHYKI